MSVMKAKDGKEPLLLMSQHDWCTKLWPAKCAQHTLLIAGAAEGFGGNDKELIRTEDAGSRAKRRKRVTNRCGGLTPNGAILLDQPTELNRHRLIGDHLLAHPIRDRNIEVG